MTQEDKDLLLKDLCARLPYGVKVLVDNKHWCDFNGHTPSEITFDNSYRLLFVGTQLGYVKPYLFPMSSITEEQRNDISKLLINIQNEHSPYGELNMKGCDNLFICVAKQANIFINYCLINHLDINGLIEKGLAFDATGLNIY